MNVAIKQSHFVSFVCGFGLAFIIYYRAWRVCGLRVYRVREMGTSGHGHDCACYANNAEVIQSISSFNLYLVFKLCFVITMITIIRKSQHCVFTVLLLNAKRMREKEAQKRGILKVTSRVDDDDDDKADADDEMDDGYDGYGG